jgi:peptide/nickel transport system ATP-binding protein
VVGDQQVVGLLVELEDQDRIEVHVDGIDLAGLSERRMRALRGARISMVMQDPKFSLNPVMRIGDQIGEVLSFHRKMNAAARRKRVMEVLEAVRITDAERVYKLYPHEVSGGMGQRIMIAMMVILEPDLMIADEPTSALDVSVQAQVLDIMDDLVNRTGMGLIIISHDLNMVARYCDRILVMFNGEIVETCAAKDLADAQHPYTQGLLASMPTIDERRTRLPVLDRTLLGGD